MKKWIICSTLAFSSLYATYHEPSVGITIDAPYPYSSPKANLHIEHQSTIELSDWSSLILHGLSHPHAATKFHNELGLGYRKLYNRFGFGVNFVYAHRNTFGFFNHQLSPGVELFYKQFSLIYNRYLPIKTGVIYKKNRYSFHDVSEVTVSYRISKNYEISLAPHYNHGRKRLGFSATASAHLFDNWKLSLTPYCEPSVRHGVAFSIGYDLGGPKKLINQRLKKSHTFYHKAHMNEVKKKEFVPVPFFLPAPQPIIMTPAVYDNGEKVSDIKPEPKPEKSKSWIEWLNNPYSK